MSPRKLLFHVAIWAVWLLLEAANIPLTIFRALSSLLRPSSVEGKPRVVIVGGSFAALAAYRHLARQFRVTLVDFKQYFEYTPGILRAFVEPAALSQMTCPLARSGFKCAEVTGVSKRLVELRTQSGETEAIEYDYLMLGSGSSYAGPIKPTTAEPLLAQRQQTWEHAAAELKTAKSVLIIGAGPVGVELAGEVLTEYPDKKVILVDAAPKVCASFPEGAIKHMSQWLTSRGVELVLGEWIDTISERGCLLKSGRQINADIVYRCMGFKPISSFLQRDFSDQLNKRGQLVVTDTLQVKDHPNIFGMGDLCLHERSNELKLGHTAELNAHLAAANLERHHLRRPMLQYPHGVVGGAVSPKVYCISLGKYDGVLVFNQIVLYGVLGGFVAAVMKWLLEWTKVAAAAGREVGIQFWELADFMSVLISKWLLPLPDPAYADKAVVLFDGECALCDGFVNFLIQHDKAKRFQFASLQSHTGGQLLQVAGLDPKDLSSMVLIDQYGYHRRSSAAIRSLAHLGGIWRLTYLLLFILAPVRDLGYKMVAANRYRLFGKLGKCEQSAAELNGRMMGQEKDM